MTQMDHRPTRLWLVCGAGLDSHSLEGAERLAHGLDFTLVGPLITDGLTEQGR